MKRLFLLPLIVVFAVNINAQIIADHTVVDQYDNIPQNWIDSVKTKLVWVPGMSHGNGYFRGVLLLEAFDSRYLSNVWYHTAPPASTSANLRIGRPYFGGETVWTSQSGIDGNINEIDNQNNTGNQYDAYIFGWSYQATWDNPPGGTIDPVYNVRWAGRSDGGPDGSNRWGLDDGDFVLTGNRVCADTYIEAWTQYNDHFNANGDDTRMIYSTLIVDGSAGTEAGFQRELKSKHIRDYVEQNPDLFLFDYADILVHNNEGELYTVNWNDGGTLRPHQQIHPDNLLDYDSNWNEIPNYPDSEKTILAGEEDHIGDVGALRLGKALWWLLARIAGWDGVATGSEKVASQTDPAVISISGEELRIEVKDLTHLPVRITLLNFQGSVVSQMDNPGNICSFSTSGLPAGIYIVSISNHGVNKTQKIFLQ